MPNTRGFLAYGSAPCAPELRRLPTITHPTIEDIRTDLEVFGHLRHRFPQSYKFDGLGFEFCCVSLSGHWFHYRLFPYLVVQKSRAPQLANAWNRIEFNMVVLMDWQFASGCSPPRLSTTQLPPATDIQCFVRRGLAPLCWCALSGAPCGAFIPQR
jgi:hypothetical protein